jgi:hypothetical protein
MADDQDHDVGDQARASRAFDSSNSRTVLATS